MISPAVCQIQTVPPERVWFSVFPLADWAYYLFAMVVATVALWTAWRLSRHYLDGDKRIVGLAQAVGQRA